MQVLNRSESAKNVQRWSKIVTRKTTNENVSKPSEAEMLATCVQVYISSAEGSTLLSCCLKNKTSNQHISCPSPPTHNRFTAIWILSGATQVSRYQKKHSPTHTYCGHQLSLICFNKSSLFNPRTWQSFSTVSKFSLVYLLAWHPPLHTPYISSPNHCLLFATHVHIIAACFAVIPRLCHLILVSLNPLLGILSCSFKPHIHLTILISACWSATSFSFLTGQLSLPCNILFRTQLLYNRPLTFNDISLLVSNGTNCLNLFHPIQILFSKNLKSSIFRFLKGFFKFSQFFIRKLSV